MSTAGFAHLKAHGGNGFWAAERSSAPPTGSSRRMVGRDEEACLVHARRTEELFPKLSLGRWAGQYGGYQSRSRR